MGECHQRNLDIAFSQDDKIAFDEDGPPADGTVLLNDFVFG